MKYKIGDLDAANVKVISVHPDRELIEATSKTALYDFSQLPVMSSTRKLNGVITWKTIGFSNNFSSPKKYVRECMDKNVAICNISDNLLDTVNSILDKEFVFIKNKEEVICGIITIYDIALQFKHLSEPIIEIQLIENSIRKYINSRIDIEKLINFSHDNFTGRKIESASDLTFGEYIRVIQNKELWSHLNIGLDRNVFIDKLESVRLIRNDIMHFKISELSKDNLKSLKDLSKFFRILDRVS